MIHPQALIDPSAEIAASAEIGPFSVIGPEVTIGEGTWIGPHVVINGPTRIGQNNLLDYIQVSHESKHTLIVAEPGGVDHDVFLDDGAEIVASEEGCANPRLFDYLLYAL